MFYLKINKIVSEDDGEEILPEENRSRVIYAPQQVGYALEYRTASFSDAVFDTWNMEFEMLLPVSDTVAQWDTDSMNWLNQGWTIQTEDCLYDFDGDGAEEQKTCQVLRGEVTLPVSENVVSGAGLGTGTLEAVVKTFESEEDEQVQPVFTAWMEHNQAGETELGSDENRVTENKAECAVHQKKEQMTVQAEPMMITKQPESQDEENRIAVYQAKTAMDFTVGIKNPVLPGSNFADYIQLQSVVYDDGTTGYGSATATSPGWPGNYVNNLRETNTSQEFSFPGATSLTITFDSTSATESNYDFVRIYDKNGKRVQNLSGTSFARKSYTVAGDYVKITFYSDGSNVGKGFSARIQPQEELQCEETLTFSPETAPLEVGQTEVTVGLAGTSISKTITVAISDVLGQWNIGKPTETDVTAVLYADGRLEVSGNGETERASNLASMRSMLTVYSAKKIIVHEGITNISDLAQELTTLESVELPESLTSIENNAFYKCNTLKEINIPDGVTSIGIKAFYDCTALSDVTLPAGLTSVGSSAFSGSGILELKVSAGALNNNSLYDCTALERITLLGGNLTDKVMAGTALKHLILAGDLGEVAENALLSDNTSQELSITVTRDTHAVPESFWKAAAKRGIANLTFEGENTLALSGLSSCGLMPYRTLKDGTYFVDKDGGLWLLDKENRTASLALAGKDQTTVQIPENVNGYTVTRIRARAFELCRNLTSVMFETPEKIKEIAPFAFAGRKKLTSINRQQEIVNVNALFASDAVIGQDAYRDTGLLASDPGYTITKDSLVYRNSDNNGPTMVISSEITKTEIKDQDQEYSRLYTGEYYSVTVSVQNTSEITGNIARVYVQMDDASGSINYAGGTYELEDQTTHKKYTLHITKDENNLYCLEFDPIQHGDTVVFNFSCSYPSPTSDGGGVRIWGEILKPGETGGGSPDRIQEACWETKVDDWSLTKSQYSYNTGTYSNEELGYTGYVYGLSYRYGLTRTGKTLEGVGKDHMKYVEFSDVLTLPEGFTWNDAIKSAVAEGKVYLDTKGTSMEGGYADGYGLYCIIDGKKYSIASLSEGASYYSGRFDVHDWNVEFIDEADGTKKLRLDWKVYNTDMSTEIDNLSSNYYRVTYGPRLIRFDMHDVQAGTSHIFHNEITADQTFCYSDKQTDLAKSDGILYMGSPQLKVSKSGTIASYFGGRADFTLKAYNQGAYPYTAYQKMVDSLPYLCYIEPDKMEIMFAEDTFGRDALTVTINHAVLHQPLDGDKESVTRSDGSTVIQKRQEQLSSAAQDSIESFRYERPTETDTNVLTEEAVITVTLNEQDQISVTVADGNGGQSIYTVGTDGGLQDIFDKIGYMPTYSATYEVVWNHENTQENPLIIHGGQTLTYQIPANIKSTFMLLSRDQQNRYPSAWLGEMNYGRAYNTSGSQIASDNRGFNPSREFELTGTVEMDGNVLDGTENIQDGSILDHTIQVVNNASSSDGSMEYPAVPVEKLITGAQVLMVEADANPQLADLGLTTVTREGTEYYLLSKDGEYQNVSVGGTIADIIQVKTAGNNSGKNTTIRWYENAGFRSTIRKNFKTMVNRSESGSTDAFYNCGGMTWLGDHESHRLYVPDPGLYGSAIKIEKQILTNPKATTEPGTDTLTDYSHIKEGEEVTYRIKFTSYATDEDGVIQPARTTLSGLDIQDRLPRSIPGYRWTKDNVTDLKFVDAKGTQEGLTFGDSGSGSDQWFISTTDVSGVTYDEGENQQFIRWNNEFSVTFDGEMYLYVTLKFPSGDLWLAYAEEYGADTLINTFFLRELQSSATHDLNEPTEAYLNKGVTDGRYCLAGTSEYYYSSGGEDSRKYYETSDSHNRVFWFYGTIYNGGHTRLYLNTLYDTIPEGFQFLGFSSYLYPSSTSISSNGASYSTTSYQKQLVTLTDENNSIGPVYKAYRIDKTELTTVGSRTRLAFKVSGNKSTGTEWVSYDEEKDKYYLNPGEAIALGYILKADGKDDSLPQIRTNSLMMEVDNYNGGGVKVADLGENGGAVSAAYPEKEKNDGECEVKGKAEIEKDYGVASSGNSQWLYSEVKLRHGEILPGIVVKPVQATNDAVVKKDFDSVEPKDKIKWELDVTNSGSAAMRNYGVTDTMPNPYEFEGDVDYTIKAADGRTWLSGKLFTIGERQENDTKATLTLYDGSTVDVPLDGTPVEIPIQMKKDGESNTLTSKARVIMKKDASGNAVLTVEFPDDALGIPEHGSAVLGVTTANPSNTLNNKVYYNHAYVTPLEQEFDHESVSHGNYTDYDYGNEGNKDSVENSSLLTVAYGYVTHAKKSITEVDQSGNVVGDTATTGEAPNYITVQDPENKLLRYTHTIENTTKKSMVRLVVIDNLPEPGDTGVFEGSAERGSAFKVVMADDPAVKVTVWNKDHTSSTVLASDQYTVTYTAKAGKYLSPDWTCDPATPTVWTDQVEADTRALRVAIMDDTGTLIPVDSTIEITFNAKVDMSQFKEDYTLEDAAGLKAYNNFGYHYRRQGDSYDLEAATDKVGAQLPCIPKLQKITVNRSDVNEPVKEDKTFTFLVHEGEALKDYTDEAAVSNELQQRGSKVGVVTLTVPAGSSVSEALLLTGAKLSPKTYDAAQKTWTKTGEAWDWTKGASYTIAEIRIPHDYADASINGTSGNVKTFTYAPETNITYKCKNTLRYGSVSLVKYDSDGTTPLAGVTFTIEGDGIQSRSMSSGKDGKLQFEYLPEGTYTIKETETTDGHVLLAEPLTVTIPLAMTEDEITAKEQETGVTIDRTKAVYDVSDGKYYFYEFGFSVTNAVSMNLPVTGGSDRWLYTELVAGLALLGGVLFLMMQRRKQRQDKAQ